MFDKEALQYLLSRAAPYSEVQNPLDLDLVTVAPGHTLRDLEEFQKAPNRIRAKVALASSESFCAYINRFKGEQSTVYLDVANGVFESVLDHHGENDPHWCQHRATFQPKKAKEWVTWTNVHDEWLTQDTLARLVERLLHTIHEPVPSVVLKAALDFQTVEKMTYGSAKNLDDGTVSFTFTKDNATKNVKFPHRITLLLSVHENEKPLSLEGRIRYKTDGNGALGFQFSFVRDPETIERDALLELAAKTKSATKGLAHYEGRLKG